MEKNKEKKLGQINTPDRLVQQMLDFGGYSDNKILGKHVLDNSCGNGQFLSEIVQRYIREAVSNKYSAKKISDELSEYIHGIEIDEKVCELCRERLNGIAENFGIDGVNWDIVCEDALLYDGFRGKMDFVFGNPPYVRVHNVKGDEGYDVMKSYKFAEKGSSDLYLAFYECGLSELKDGGTLCYITPSSWLSSASGKNMRDYILENNTLSAIVDFGHTQIFDNAQTYTLVSLFKNKRCDNISYLEYNDGVFDPISSVTYSNICIDGKFYFAKNDDLEMLKKIESIACDKVRVKNGLATLDDKFFIDGLDNVIANCGTTALTIPVVKASTGKWGRCFFPYKYKLLIDGGKLRTMPLEEIKEESPSIYNYVMSHEEELKARTYDNGSNWWEIGRSQGLSDTFKDKIAINNLTKGPGDIKITAVPAGSHVYSGFYILTNTPFEKIKKALHSKQFFNYVKALKKYKSGEYYTFSSKDVEKFLNYWIYGNK